MPAFIRKVLDALKVKRSAKTDTIVALVVTAVAVAIGVDVTDLSM